MSGKRLAKRIVRRTRLASRALAIRTGVPIKPRVLVAVPSYRSMSTVFVKLLFSWTKRADDDDGYTADLRIQDGTVVDYSRNILAYGALKDGFDYVLFVDDDTLFPEDAVARLVGHRKDIVGGLVFRKDQPYHPTIYRAVTQWAYEPIIDYEREALMQVDAIGAACTMFSRRALESIGQPWFSFSRDPYLSEDLNICRRARAAGLSIYCDTAVKCGHVGGIITEQHFRDARSCV